MTTAPGFVRRITKGGVKTLRGLLGIEGVGQTLEPVESVSLCISVVLVYSSENNPMHIYYLHTYLSTTYNYMLEHATQGFYLCARCTVEPRLKIRKYVVLSVSHV